MTAGQRQFVPASVQTQPSPLQELARIKGNEAIRMHDYRVRQIEQGSLTFPELPQRCDQCPFGPNRDSLVTDEVMVDVMTRVDAGDRWICHKTTGPDGSLLENTKYCAGVNHGD